MKKKTGTLFLFAAMIVMAACSGPMVQTQRDRSVNFTTLMSYAWQPLAGKIGPGLPNDPTLETRIRSAVDSTLQTKGLHAVPEGNADLLLEYRANAEKKVDASNLKYYETAEFMDMTYTLGTLTLTMKRSSSPATVAWEGSVQAHIDMSRPLEERDKKLRAAVQKLLEKFPPK